ncbi:MAG TPA: serpin family protein [Tepidisphaeraceae bacterium]|jgi:serpin B
MAKGIDQFGVDLYQRLPAGENLFFSPASISTAFGMAYAGARGQTADEIARVMRFDAPPAKLGTEAGKLLRDWNDGDDKRGYELAVANAMWGQKGYPYARAFGAEMARDYGAGLHLLDFGQPEPARMEINKWVEDQTKGKITNLIPQGGVTPATRLVLTNAVYFKSAWDQPFNKGGTRPEPFKLGGEKTADVPTMHQMGHFHLLKSDGMSALEMPYGHGALSMIVLLPDEVEGLAAMEKNLTYEKLEDWIGKLQSQPPGGVVVSFPKFKMTRELALGQTLAAMGMKQSFTGSADFSGMVSTGSHERVTLSEAYHKAYVDVNEEGTEAAAATGLVMRATAMSAVQGTFNADHPFMIVIRENMSGVVLFMGRVVNPGR